MDLTTHKTSTFDSLAIGDHAPKKHGVEPNRIFPEDCLMPEVRTPTSKDGVSGPELLGSNLRRRRANDRRHQASSLVSKKTGLAWKAATKKPSAPDWISASCNKNQQSNHFTVRDATANDKTASVHRVVATGQGTSAQRCDDFDLTPTVPKVQPTAPDSAKMSSMNGMMGRTIRGESGKAGHHIEIQTRRISKGTSHAIANEVAPTLGPPRGRPESP